MFAREDNVPLLASCQNIMTVGSVESFKLKLSTDFVMWKTNKTMLDEDALLKS